MRTMKRHRHTPEQAVRKIREGERLLKRGRRARGVLRQLEVSEATWNREIAKEHPRWGWKTAHEILLREGWMINRKRTRRIWRQEGLRRPVRARKRRRASNGQATRLRATKPNEVWAVDFQFDETSDRRRIKLCNIVDEYTREALAIRVDRTCTAENVITIIEQLVTQRGTPKYLRADNGPEMIAWTLQDYCRLAGLRPRTSSPAARGRTQFVESFDGRLRDELLNIEEFACLTDARVIIEDWRIQYNTYRPHSALRGTHAHRVRNEKRTTNTNQTTHKPWLTYRDPSRAQGADTGVHCSERPQRAPSHHLSHL